MTTIAVMNGGTIGYTSIQCRNVITLSKLPSLMQSLLYGFGGAVTFSPYEDSIEGLRECADAAIRDGAMSPDAQEVLAGAIGPAEALLISRPSSVPPPEVEVWDSGKIAFEWYVSPSRIVNVTIDRGGRLVYSALVGQARVGGVAFDEGKWPNELVNAIRRIRL